MSYRVNEYAVGLIFCGLQDYEKNGGLSQTIFLLFTNEAYTRTHTCTHACTHTRMCTHTNIHGHTHMLAKKSKMHALHFA